MPLPAFHEKSRRLASEWVDMKAIINPLPDVTLEPNLVPIQIPDRVESTYLIDEVVESDKIELMSDPNSLPKFSAFQAELFEERLGRKRKVELKIDPKDRFLLNRSSKNPGFGQKQFLEKSLFLNRKPTQSYDKTYGRPTVNLDIKSLRVMRKQRSSIDKEGTEQEPDKVKAERLADCIETTFQSVKELSLENLVHPTKRDLKAVEILHVIPNSKNSDKINRVFVSFDVDPRRYPREDDTKRLFDEAILLKENKSSGSVYSYNIPKSIEMNLSPIETNPSPIEMNLSPIETNPNPGKYVEYQWVKDYEMSMYAKDSQHALMLLPDKNSDIVIMDKIYSKMSFKRKRVIQGIDSQGDKRGKLLVSIQADGE